MISQLRISVKIITFNHFAFFAEVFEISMILSICDSSWSETKEHLISAIRLSRENFLIIFFLSILFILKRFACEDHSLIILNINYTVIERIGCNRVLTAIFMVCKRIILNELHIFVRIKTLSIFNDLKLKTPKWLVFGQLWSCQFLQALSISTLWIWGFVKLRLWTVLIKE